MITVNSRSYDGAIRRSWKCELVERRDPLILFVGKFDADVEHSDLGLIEKGTISYEYYWLDRWYNIFRFHTPDGNLRNFYCNISMPPRFADDVLDYVDLDIDVLVWPDGRHVVLDLDDYQVSCRTLGYPPEVKDKVEETLQVLLQKIKATDLPEMSELIATSDADKREES